MKEQSKKEKEDSIPRCKNRRVEGRLGGKEGGENRVNRDEDKSKEDAGNAEK